MQHSPEAKQYDDYPHPELYVTEEYTFAYAEALEARQNRMEQQEVTR